MLKRLPLVTTLVLCAFITVNNNGADRPDMPDYWPTCVYPSPGAPIRQLSANAVTARTGMTWNGRDFATLHADNASRLVFQRLYADGSSAAPPVIVRNDAYSYFGPGLVWNGAGYAAAWSNSFGFIQFALLNVNGAIISGPTPVSATSFGSVIIPGSVSLVTNGSGYLVAWQNNAPVTGMNIVATLFNADGTIAGPGNSYLDLVVSNAANGQIYQTATWLPVSGNYLVAWSDARNGSNYEIWSSLLNPATGVVSPNAALISLPGFDAYPASLASAANGAAMAWSDNRFGNNEISFARISNSGTLIGLPVRLSNDAAFSSFPNVTWTGAEYDVFWDDRRSGNPDVWFQSVSASGIPQGGNTQLTFSADLGLPTAAFGRYGYLLTASPYLSVFSGGPSVAGPIGCSYSSTPTCAGNLTAYNITGTTATISWLDAQDNYNDIAYYQILRNNAPVGRTSSAVFSDTGLSTSVTYNYTIQAVNALQFPSSIACPVLFLKTNSSLTLTMNKSNPHAQLDWTDVGFSSYSIFRGTNPQVMSQIGATPALTTQDLNVLYDTVSYFYTVDDPGQ